MYTLQYERAKMKAPLLPWSLHPQLRELIAKEGVSVSAHMHVHMIAQCAVFVDFCLRELIETHQFSS